MLRQLIDNEMDKFIKNDCTACGGHWVRMMFTGIHKRYPEYYDSISDTKIFSFGDIVKTVRCLIACDILNIN